MRTEWQKHKIAIEVQDFLNALEHEMVELTGGYPAIVRKVDDSIVIADVDGDGKPTIEVICLEEAFWCVRFAKRNPCDTLSEAYMNAEVEFQSFYEDLKNDG